MWREAEQAEACLAEEAKEAARVAMGELAAEGDLLPPYLNTQANTTTTLSTPTTLVSEVTTNKEALSWEDYLTCLQDLIGRWSSSFNSSSNK